MASVNDPAVILITSGCLLLAGLALDTVARRIRLPRVTLLMLLGVIAGRSGLQWIHAEGFAFELIADLALVMVGFLLGERLTLKRLRAHGRAVLWISGTVTLLTVMVIAISLWLAGLPLHLALALGGIATATDPAATVQTLQDNGARGPFTDTLLGVVAIDDAWGVMMFSLILAVVAALTGSTQTPAEALVEGSRDLLGAAALGLGLGVPAARLTGRLAPGEPTLLEALGLVLLCGGLALWFDVSFLLASMVLGATVAHGAKHHTRPFHAIEGIERPLLILFFVFAGAMLDIQLLASLGAAGIAYISARVVGRLSGAWIGAKLGGADAATGRWMGWALLPQAGVALGMALVAAERLPEHGPKLMSIAVGTTVFFELLGPIGTQWAVRHVGETPTA